MIKQPADLSRDENWNAFLRKDSVRVLEEMERRMMKVLLRPPLE